MPSIKRRVRYGKVQKIQQAIQITGTSAGSGAGVSYNQAAERLGTTSWSIRDWVHKLRQTGELPDQSQTQPENMELLKNLSDQCVDITKSVDFLVKTCYFMAVLISL